MNIHQHANATAAACKHFYSFVSARQRCSFITLRRANITKMKRRDGPQVVWWRRRAAAASGAARGWNSISQAPRLTTFGPRPRQYPPRKSFAVERWTPLCTIVYKSITEANFNLHLAYRWSVKKSRFCWFSPEPIFSFFYWPCMCNSAGKWKQGINNSSNWLETGTWRSGPRAQPWHWERIGRAHRTLSFVSAKHLSLRSAEQLIFN